MLTEKPHLGGTEQNHELGRKLKVFWEDAGLDSVVLAPYQVHMAPRKHWATANYISLLALRMIE